MNTTNKRGSEMYVCFGVFIVITITVYYTFLWVPRVNQVGMLLLKLDTRWCCMWQPGGAICKQFLPDNLTTISPMKFKLGLWIGIGNAKAAFESEHQVA